MKYLIVIAYIVLSSCGPVYPGSVACSSRCGLSLLDPISQPKTGVGLSCDTLQDAEDNALMELAQASDPRMKLGCLSIKDWFIVQDPREKIPVRSNQNESTTIAGMTECGAKRITLSNLSWRVSAFTHELAHAAQGCQTWALSDVEDQSHWQWNENGIFAAIDRVAALEPHGEQ